MHPEIKKFWEKSENKVIIDILQDDLWTFYWVLIDDLGRQIRFVGQSAPQLPGTKEASCTIYFFESKSVTEQIMLKIIKLTAFL
jgi:hypothetical protein